MSALRIRVLTAALLMAASLPCGRASAADAVLRSFTAGTGDQAVGVAVSEGAQDREEDGPQAIASDEKGRLYLLDQVNRRILTFDPANPNAPTQSLRLPADVQPSDLVVKGDSIYVWDGKIHALTPLGAAEAPTRGLAETRAGEQIDDATRSAFAQMGSESGDQDDGDTTRGVAKKMPTEPNRQHVDTRGHGTVTVDVALTDRGAGALLSVVGQDGTPVVPKLAIKVPGRLGTVAFLNIDEQGRLFVLAEDVPESVRDSAFAFVARFSPKGLLEGVYEVPLEQTTGVSRRAVTVSPDGDVYFLKTSKKGADVVGLGFVAMPSAKIIALGKPNLPAIAWNDSAWVGMAVGPLTRQRIVQTALRYEGIPWTVKPENYGPDQDKVCSGFNGRIRRPMYMIGKENQQVHGVPYCWGCQGSLQQFTSRIQKGALAGNVCTKEDPQSDAAGVDCSSFVSAAWGLGTHFTTAAIPAIAQQLDNPWDLKPGDALDKPGSHVVLFLSFTRDRQARVIEASPGACQGRVCQNTYPLSALLARGFIPVRYRAVVEDASSNTQGKAKSVAQ